MGTSAQFAPTVWVRSGVGTLLGPLAAQVNSPEFEVLSMEMDAGRDKAKLEFEYWAGTLDQLVRAARHAADEIATLMPCPEDYDPEGEERHAPYNRARAAAWEQAKEARELSIVVPEKEGFTAHPRDLDELASMSETAAASVEDIVIFIGSTWRPPGVVIKCGRSYIKALIVEIEGFDCTRTAGLKHELTTILKPKWRLHAPLLGERALGALMGTIAFFVVFIGLDQLAYHEHAWTKAIRVVVSLGMAALVAVAVAAVTLASQQFELLLSAGRPKYQRWRTRVVSAAGAVLLGLIASAIWAILSGS